MLLREYLENGTGRIGKFVVEAQVNGHWQALAEGASVGVSKRIDFKACETAALRLRVLDASAPPSLYSFLAFDAQSRTFTVPDLGGE